MGLCVCDVDAHGHLYKRCMVGGIEDRRLQTFKRLCGFRVKRTTWRIWMDGTVCDVYACEYKRCMVGGIEDKRFQSFKRLCGFRV